jgi:uncharacterized membrane protein
MLHISSIVLAPYCILGAEIVFNLIVKIIKPVIGFRIQQFNVLNIIAVILIVFCIFTTTVPFVLAKSEEGRSAPLTMGYILSGQDVLPLQQTIQYRSASPTSIGVPVRQNKMYTVLNGLNETEIRNMVLLLHSGRPMYQRS